jgi:phospholipase/lecithinase/hemolysin
MIKWLGSRMRALGIITLAMSSLLVASCGSSDSADPDLFKTVVVFGASVSDTGNTCAANSAGCPPSPPYAAGKYSNGTLWIETVAANLGASAKPSLAGGTNYSFAGARTGTVPGVTAAQSVPNMRTQLGMYLAKVGNKADPKALYVIDGVTVGNNISDALVLAATDPTAPNKVVSAAVGDIGYIVEMLYSMGARNIVVANSTDIGMTPQVQAYGAAAAAGATAMSLGFNGGVAQYLSAYDKQLPGLSLYTVDVGTIVAQMTANPSAYGLNNVKAPCFNTLVSPPTLCATPDTYLYWDPFHPTVAAGSVLAKATMQAIGR